MTFEDVKDDGRLWAVHFDGENLNELDRVFSQWNDAGWLLKFFRENFNDLVSYFKITKLDEAVYDTMADSDQLECLILDISPDANLDELFRPLENSRASEMMLSKEKARLQSRPKHASWLRIYAIKLNPGIYVVTGGAIKLTRTMQEREHTLKELEKMEKVRQYLVANGVIDDESFNDFINS
ncbi:MAG: hypothetical protein IJ911_03595 [Salinivirgaceae bacterium]|nr:hypothetical protein [Salinivirgaceae bacterium]